MSRNKNITNAVKTEFVKLATGIINYYRNEFGAKLENNKLIFKLSKCGNKRCKSCPHGPYWYRATFNKKTRRWMFKYIGNLTKSLLRSKIERELWHRYKFYNDEIKRIKKERKERLKKAR